MEFSTKIKMAEAVARMKEAELARQIGTTPQAFNQRMKTGKFKYEELEQIAAALGARTDCQLPISGWNRGMKKARTNKRPGRGEVLTFCGYCSPFSGFAGPLLLCAPHSAHK